MLCNEERSCGMSPIDDSAVPVADETLKSEPEVVGEEKPGQAPQPFPEAPSGSCEILWGYCGLCVRHPRKMFISIAVLMITMGVIGGPYMVPGASHSNDWSISEAHIVEQSDALDAAIALTSGSESVTAMTLANVDQAFTILFDWNDGRSESVFTPKNIQTICEVENLILKLPSWPSWCPVDVTNTSICAPQNMVITNYFYDISSYPVLDGVRQPYRTCSLLDSSVVDAAAALLVLTASNVSTANQVGFFMMKDTPSKGYTLRTRTYIEIGGPLPGFVSLSARKTESVLKYQNYVKDFVRPSFYEEFDMEDGFGVSAYYKDAIKGDLEMRFSSQALQNYEFDLIIATDTLFAGFSVLFVFCYVWFHTGTAFIAAVAILIIVLALPISAFIMAEICQIAFFDYLQVLAIFLCLGIGADDIFVFMDAFASVQQVEGKSLQWMLWYTVRHTRQAVLNTSLTTTIAFIALGISPIMPIQVFGYFAAVAICLIYVFVLVLVPPALVVYQQCCLRNHTCCCCICCGCLCPPGEPQPIDPEPLCECCCRPEEPMQESYPLPPRGAPPPVLHAEDLEGQQAPNVEKSPGGCCESLDDEGARVRKETGASMLCIDQAGQQKFLPYKDLQDQFPQLIPTLPFMQRMLVTKYMPCMRYEVGGFKVVAIGLVIFFTAMFCVLGSFAIQMEQPTSQEQWFAPHHMWYNLFDDMAQQYMGGSVDDYVGVNLVFGISGLDRTGFDKFVPHLNRGSPIFDSNFDISTTVNQNAIIDACNKVDATLCTAPGCNMPTLAYPGSVHCFMKDFTTWYNTTYGTSTLPTGATFNTRLLEFRSNFSGEAFQKSYNYLDNIGVVDGQIKFCSIPFTTTLLSLQSYQVTKGVYDATEAMIAVIAATMPDGLKNILDVSAIGSWGRTWDFLTIQEALVQGLYQGFAICFPASFFVLLFATRNAVTALYAIITIAAICASVLGFAHGAFGYELGIIESIAAVCVIGFSVDYTVHLAHMYHEAAEDDRAERSSFAAMHMGATVFGGAVTTMGAGMILLLGVLTFFQKMGTIMCLTIFFSYMSSMFCFMPLLFILGPSGSFGSIQFIFEYISAQTGSTVAATNPNNNGNSNDQTATALHIGVHEKDAK